MANSLTNYREFSVQQFLEDPFFREWVLRPDFESDQFWSDWVSANPDKEVEVEEAKNLLLELRLPEYSLSQEEIEEVWDKVKVRTRSKNREWITHSGKTILWRRFATASIAAVLALGIWWGMVQEKWVEVKTGYGETLSLTLSDSSQLILNANSTVRYAKEWESGEPREIWLEGEAFFDVVHLKSHQPFLVHTANGVEIEVLGTSFSVYDRNRNSQVVLEEGNVSLSLSNTNQSREKILMKPGDLVAIKQNKIEKKVVKTKNYTSWTQNLLILDQTSLEEIIRVGRENFGLQIEIDPKVSLNQTASGSMPIEDPEDFMNLTSKIFNISIEKKEFKYLLKP